MKISGRADDPITPEGDRHEHVLAQKLLDPVGPVLVAVVAEVRRAALGPGIHDAGAGAKRRVVDATNNLGQAIVEPRAGGDGRCLQAGLLPGVRDHLDKGGLSPKRKYKADRMDSRNRLKPEDQWAQQPRGLSLA